MPTTEDTISRRYTQPGTIQIDFTGAAIVHDVEELLLSESVPSEDEDTPSLQTELNGLSDKVRRGLGLRSTAMLRLGSNLTMADLDLEEEDLDTGVRDYTKKIMLPHQSQAIGHLAVDIGGTLTKLVYFSRNSSGLQGGKMHFRYYHTEQFETEVLRFIRRRCGGANPVTHIVATGGGLQKYQKLMKAAFGRKVKLVAKDEMECLITGLDFFIQGIPREIYTYDYRLDVVQYLDLPVTDPLEVYPYMLVNIGLGVLMIKVEGPNSQFERIGGLSLGGGTLWGLLLLLTLAQNYNEMLDMAKRGNNDNIDLLVGDIYGLLYNNIGLKSTHIALLFAKVFKKLKFKLQQRGRPLTLDEKFAEVNENDILRLLLYSVSNNIGQIAYLQAQRHNLKRIYFGGSYILGHQQTIHTLLYAVDFWSKGDMKAYFLRHEAYLGSVGAFLSGPKPRKRSTLHNEVTE